MQPGPGSVDRWPRLPHDRLYTCHPPLSLEQHASSLSVCCTLSWIAPQPAHKKHGSCGPRLQKGFLQGKSHIYRKKKQCKYYDFLFKCTSLIVVNKRTDFLVFL